MLLLLKNGRSSFVFSTVTMEQPRQATIFLSSCGLGGEMLGTILIVLLILALCGALPRWSHSRNWGYYPMSGLGVVLIIVIILLLVGRI